MPAVIYFGVIALGTTLVLSHKARVFFMCVLLCAVLVWSACALQNVARAEEVRTVFVVGFDLANGAVELEDEDGFVWAFGLGTNSWYLGQEYTLVLPDDAEPYLM